MRWSWYFDLYQLEHRVVRARNYLNFRFQPKDDRGKQKIFVVGHPRTGTKSFHQLFKGNGLKSLHKSGNWDTRSYDCFSDRGNLRPLQLLVDYYPNSVFILNTRPVYKYIRSVINHRFGRGRKSSGWFEPSVTNIENEIIERNQDFLEFVRTFKDGGNCLVANIEREGAFDFVCERLGLRSVEIKNSGRSSWREKDLAKIEEAFANLGIDETQEEPFLLDPLINEEERVLLQQFRETHRDSIFL